MNISIFFAIFSLLNSYVLAMNPSNSKNSIYQPPKIAPSLRIPSGKRPDFKAKSSTNDLNSYFGRKKDIGSFDHTRLQRPNTMRESGYLFAIGYDTHSHISRNMPICDSHDSYYHPGMIKMAQPQVPSWEVNDLYSKVLSADPKTAKSCLIRLIEIDGLSFSTDLEQPPFRFTAALIPKHNKFNELESSIVIAKDDQNYWSLKLPNGTIVTIKPISYPKQTTNAILTRIGEEITGIAYNFVDMDGLSRRNDLSQSPYRFIAAIIPKYNKNNQFDPPLFIARDEKNQWSLKLPNCTVVTFNRKSYPQQSMKAFLAGIGKKITGNAYHFVGYFKVPKDFSTKLYSFGINLNKELVEPSPLMTQSMDPDEEEDAVLIMYEVKRKSDFITFLYSEFSKLNEKDPTYTEQLVQMISVSLNLCDSLNMRSDDLPLALQNSIAKVFKLAQGLSISLESALENSKQFKPTQKQIQLPMKQPISNTGLFQRFKNNNNFVVKAPLVSVVPEVGDLNYKGFGQLMNSPYFYAIDAKNHKELSGHPGIFKFNCPECNQTVIDSLNKQTYYDDEMTTSCTSIKTLMLIDGHSIVPFISKHEIYDPFEHYIVVIVPNRQTSGAINEPRFFRLNKRGKWSYKPYMQPEQVVNQDPFDDFNQSIEVLKQNTNNGDCMVAGVFKIGQSFKEKVKRLMN